MVVASSLNSSSTGFATISVLIISFNSSRFSASTLTICTRPGVRICFCATFKLSLSPCQAMFAKTGLPLLLSDISVQAEMVAQIHPPHFGIIAQILRATLTKNPATF